MKQIRKLKKMGALKNQGFSLLELLISITILVLILVPLMNNFYHSMLMNKKAEEIQNQTNLASSIMEGLKSLNMEKTIKEFTGENLFDIISVPIGTPILVLEYNAVTGLYTNIDSPEYATLKGQTTYYFAINGIQKGGSVYDALIKMNAGEYRTNTILNNYPMPDAINLNDMLNGLLYSGGETPTDDIDSKALATFLEYGQAYAKTQFEQSSSYQTYLSDYSKWQNDCETAKMQNPVQPTPAPPAVVSFKTSDYADYCSDSKVRAYITKKMKINVNQGLKKTLTYRMEYTCNWPAGSNIESNLKYPVFVKEYPSILNNIYLFYKPSVFKDSGTITIHQDLIEVNNETPDKAINFYVAYQNAGVTLRPDVTISKLYKNKDSSGNTITYPIDPVSIFTDLESQYVGISVNGSYTTGGYNTNIVDTEIKDRIYSVDVSIYEASSTGNPVDKYQKKLYSLSSTRED